MATKRKTIKGDGSVFYRHPTDRRKGTWVAQYYVTDPLTGKARTITRSAPTRDAARDLLQALRDQPLPIGRAKDAPITLAAWLATWVEHNLPRLPIKDSTKNLYALCVRLHAIPNAGTVALADLTPSAAELLVERIAGAVSTRTGKPLAASTVLTTFVVIGRALDTAVRDGLIDSNPMRSIDRPRNVKAHVGYADADHTDRLLKACAGRRIEPLAWFVAFTGCRIGEALGLKWSDVDLQAGTATIRRSGPGAASTKNDKARTVSLLPEVTERLRSVHLRATQERLAMGAGWQDTGHVFTTATGRPVAYRSANRELTLAIEAANRDGGHPLPTARPWHTLRHGVAHRLIAKGVPLPMVSAMLGHSSIAITVDTYGHVAAAIPSEVLAAALR